jgi:hypothetical protein
MPEARAISFGFLQELPGKYPASLRTQKCLSCFTMAKIATLVVKIQRFYGE